MTNDRTTELYEGHTGTPIEQRLTAARIHWMISQVKGPDVLDIGCGQGIASLLLAREGRRAVGIDRNPETIQWARQRATGELESVHSRLTYDVAEAGNLPFPDDSFDSVLIGAVLEEQVDPTLVIREALRVLRADGRFVTTSLYAELRAPPFGEPLYLQGLIGLLSGTIDVDDIALLDRYVAIAGVATVAGAAKPSSVVWLRALEVAERNLARLLESSLHAHAERTALAHLASESAAEASRLEDALAVEREATRVAIGEAAQNRIYADTARDEVAELTGIVTRLKGKASAQAERLSALEDAMTAAESDQKRLDQRWRIATDRAGRLERELAAARPTVSEDVAEPEPRRRSAATSGRSQSASVPAPRVLHVMARSLPHATSPVALDRHGLLVAQRRAGLDSSAMTGLDFPWDIGIADPAVCDVVDGVAYYRLREPDHPPGDDMLARAVRIGDQLLTVVEPQILHAASLDVAPLAIALARSHSLRSVVELSCELTGGDFDAALLAGADHVVALSDEQKQRAILAGVPERCIVVIPAFVDMTRFASPKRPSSNGSSPPVLGAVVYDRDSPVIDEVRRAIAEAGRPVCGLVVRVADPGGGGFESAEPNRPIAEGSVYEADVEASGLVAWLERIDIVIAATPHEALDAMAAGRAVVGVGAATDLVPGLDQLPLLIDDRRLRTARGAAAREGIEANHTDAAVRAYERLYAVNASR